MFYKKDVYNYFKLLKSEYLCVYYNEPLPVKMRLVDAMYALTGFTKSQLNSLTIPELTELLVNELESKTLIILFNHSRHDREIITDIPAPQQHGKHPSYLQFQCS